MLVFKTLSFAQHSMLRNAAFTKFTTNDISCKALVRNQTDMCGNGEQHF